MESDWLKISRRWRLSATSREYGTGFPILTHAKSDDGLLDVCVLPCKSHADVVRLAMLAATGDHLHEEGVIYVQGRSVRIESPQPVPVQIDGDAAGHHAAVISSCLIRNWRLSCRDGMNDLIHLDRFPLFVIAGPCVIESAELCLTVGSRVQADLREAGHLTYIFKASFDKANRSSNSSFPRSGFAGRIGRAGTSETRSWACGFDGRARDRSSAGGGEGRRCPASAGVSGAADGFARRLRTNRQGREHQKGPVHVAAGNGHGHRKGQIRRQ